ASADEDVSTAVATAFHAAGIAVHEDFGSIESFEEAPGGVMMNFSKDRVRGSAEAAVVVVPVGWTAGAGGAGRVEYDFCEGPRARQRRGGGGRRRGRLDGGHGGTRPRDGWRRHRSPGLRERRLRVAHHRAAHLRRRGRDRSSDARPASDPG